MTIPSLLVRPPLSSDELIDHIFTQVVFGYVSITSILQLREHPLPDDLTTVLTILFPTGHTWIPASDWF